MAAQPIFLTLEEVARLFKIGRATVYKWRGEGLPYIKIGRAVRYEQEAILQWARQYMTEDGNGDH